VEYPKMGDPVMALSVKQPWASLIASGRKTIETRMYCTRHRGWLLIMASRVVDDNAMDIMGDARLGELPGWHPLRREARWLTSDYMYGTWGRALCLVWLVDDRPLRMDDVERSLCPLTEFGQRAWVLCGAVPVVRQPVRGMPGMFRVPFPGLLTGDGTAVESGLR
jgi:hypothetical protein